MSQFYTSGQFAKKANVSIRTIRYYDKQGLLKPAGMSSGGYRLYTDSDFAKLQKILSLKYLGFSLDEIRSITINDNDKDYVGESIKLQLNLIRKKIEHLKLVEQTLTETSRLVMDDKSVDWSKILHLIHITNMEKTLVEQYKDAANVSIRIGLHKRYTMNKQGWFRWLYERMEPIAGKRVLELGCGNGELWRSNEDKIPRDANICLTDVSKGMVRDAEDNLNGLLGNLSFEVLDCRQILKPEGSFDIAVAHHVLFYLSDLSGVLTQIYRVLTPGGIFCCSTYGCEHMKEIGQLVREFDSRITLSEVNLYDVFGLENGEEILARHFSSVKKEEYQDSLEVTDAGALMEYILSCHGNQQEYLSDRYEEFREFLEKKMKKRGTIHITKQAGAFLCTK
ncbi:methyltransferase domain-containing protein [Clostridium sp. E02]|uniref:MerR family transcriptional regulator n=1 Tax=Clostridium sp. E02 TaxID=2487134 RepID=UPI000F5377A2|nr:methyltransferase domain-containing protein [Clostridium sp. E02]